MLNSKNASYVVCFYVEMATSECRKESHITATQIHCILIRLLGVSEQFAKYTEWTNIVLPLDVQELNSHQLPLSPDQQLYPWTPLEASPRDPLWAHALRSSYGKSSSTSPILLVSPATL